MSVIPISSKDCISYCWFGVTTVTYKINASPCAVFSGPSIPSSLSYINCLLHKSFPRTCSILRPHVTIHKSLILYGKQLLSLAQSLAMCWLAMTGHSVSCSYCPYLSAAHGERDPLNIDYIVLLFSVVI